jgi:hypothetical protein
MPSIMPDGGLHANAGYCVPRIGNSTDVCWSKAKCDENQYCFPSTPSQKVCVVIPYQDTDKFCSTDADCKNDLFCDTSKSKCASKADVGGKCTRDEHCKSFRCNIGKRNCIASADKGQGCNYSEQCKGGLWCLPQPAVGECRAPDIQVGAGEKCDNKNIFCQQGLRCFAGFCSAPIPDGQTCAADADCLDASFCNALLKCEARKGAGAECTKSSMCTADLYCFTGASPAVCTIRKNEGEACTAGSCAQGFFCSGDLGICVAQFGDGSKCMSGDQCVKGLMCKQYEGICTDRVNNDAYCDVSNECKEDLFCSPATLDKACWQKRNAQLNEPCLGSNVYCATGLYCSFDTGTCVNRKDDGQACTSSGQCKDTLYCNIITTEKKCRPRGALDADCGGTGMAPCGKDFYCDGTKCKNRLDATQPCSSSSMCKADLYCDLGGTNQCTQRKDAGADCTATSQCKENMKCDTSVTPNKCAALGGQGVKCTANADCQENYYCRQATGKCASRLGTGVECPVLDACVKADACNTKATCKDLLGEGEKCSYDTDCKKELVCDREWLECSKKPEGAKTGDHCRANYECQSGFCSQEICAAACMGHYKQ